METNETSLFSWQWDSSVIQEASIYLWSSLLLIHNTIYWEASYIWWEVCFRSNILPTAFNWAPTGHAVSWWSAVDILTFVLLCGVYTSCLPLSWGSFHPSKQSIWLTLIQSMIASCWLHSQASLRTVLTLALGVWIKRLTWKGGNQEYTLSRREFHFSNGAWRFEQEHFSIAWQTFPQSVKREEMGKGQVACEDYNGLSLIQGQSWKVTTADTYIFFFYCSKRTI